MTIESGSIQEDGSIAVQAVADGNQPIRNTGEVSGNILEATLTASGGEIPMTLRRES